MSGRVWFYDGASGTRGGEDAAVAHALQVGEMTVLLAIRVWHPPFSPAAVVAEVAQMVKASGLVEITGDRWATGVVPEMFSAHAITYHPCELDKSQLYLQLLPLVNAGRVRLLDHPELLRQLRGLERRRGWGGRDRVDHRRGQHDDLANAAAGAIVLAAQESTYVPAKFVADRRRARRRRRGARVGGRARGGPPESLRSHSAGRRRVPARDRRVNARGVGRLVVATSSCARPPQARPSSLALATFGDVRAVPLRDCEPLRDPCCDIRGARGPGMSYRRPYPAALAV